jgi:hypothetical protein
MGDIKYSKEFKKLVESVFTENTEISKTCESDSKHLFGLICAEQERIGTVLLALTKEISCHLAGN